jgi:hypothetical protein
MYDVVMGQRLGIILKSQGSIMCVLLKYQTIFIQNKYKRKMRTLCSNVKHVEIFSYLMAETKDCEMSQICIVSVKFLKDVRDFDRNAANWQ